ncbi:hypothetical protein M8C21_010374, partial [Ambrosia artemisiifolia]
TSLEVTERFLKQLGHESYMKREEEEDRDEADRSKIRVAAILTTTNRFGCYTDQVIKMLLKWFVQEGDQIEEYQRLSEVQSDKATIEITSRRNGKVAKVPHTPNDIITSKGLTPKAIPQSANVIGDLSKSKSTNATLAAILAALLIDITVQYQVKEVANRRSASPLISLEYSTGWDPNPRCQTVKWEAKFHSDFLMPRPEVNELTFNECRTCSYTRGRFDHHLTRVENDGVPWMVHRVDWSACGDVGVKYKKMMHAIQGHDYLFGTSNCFRIHWSLEKCFELGPPRLILCK